jgi:hypothetical protein
MIFSLRNHTSAQKDTTLFQWGRYPDVQPGETYILNQSMEVFGK